MSGTYIDGDTLPQCHEALRDGRTLDDLAGRLHIDTEYLGRLLQLPTTPAVSNDDDGDLWRTDELDAVL